VWGGGKVDVCFQAKRGKEIPLSHDDEKQPAKMPQKWYRDTRLPCSPPEIVGKKEENTKSGKKMETPDEMLKRQKACYKDRKKTLVNPYFPTESSLFQNSEPG